MLWIHRFEAWVTGLCMFVVVASLGLQVFLRYVLNNPLPWPEEVAKFAFVWCAFFGAALGVHRKAHIAVEVLVNRFPSSLRRLTEAAVHLLVLLVLAVLVKSGLDMVRLSVTSRLPAIGVALAWLYVPVPVCAGLMMLDFGRLLRDALRAAAPPGTGAPPGGPLSRAGG